MYSATWLKVHLDQTGESSFYPEISFFCANWILFRCSNVFDNSISDLIHIAYIIDYLTYVFFRKHFRYKIRFLCLLYWNTYLFVRTAHNNISFCRSRLLIWQYLFKCRAFRRVSIKRWNKGTYVTYGTFDLRWHVLRSIRLHDIYFFFYWRTPLVHMGKY